MSKLADIDIDGTGALSTLRRISEGIEGLEHKVKSFGMAFAGFGLAYEAMSKVAEGFEGIMEYGSRLEALHQSTGESIHDLVIFGRALDNSGGSAENAQNFIFKLQNALAGVNEDGKSTAESLKLLGTNAQSLRNLPLLEQVEALQKGLAKIPDQATKVAAVKDLFGFRFAAQTMPLLTNPDALDKAKKQSGDFADAMDQDAAKIHELETTIKGLEFNMQGFFLGALEKIAPGANDAADALSKIDFLDLGRGAGEILDVFVEMGKVLADLAPIINRVAAAMDNLLHHQLAAGALVGAGIGSFIEPGGGTVVGGILGAAAGLLFGGGSGEKKGFAESFRGLNAPEARKDSISSLQRAGLGGGFGGGGDPLLGEAQRHTALLQQIEKNTGKGSGIPGIPDPPPV